MFRQVYNIIEEVLEQVETVTDVVDYNLGESALNINLVDGRQLKVPYEVLESENRLEWIVYQLEK